MLVDYRGFKIDASEFGADIFNRDKQYVCTVLSINDEKFPVQTWVERAKTRIDWYLKEEN